MSTEQPIRYAGFWKRFAAYGYDIIIVQLLALIPMFLFYQVPTLEQIIMLAPEADSWFSTFTNSTILVSAIYNIGCVASTRQATPGKRYCGIYVIRSDGGRPSLATATWRHITSGISTLMCWLGFLTVAFTREKLGIHDMLAHTRVIYGKPTL